MNLRSNRFLTLQNLFELRKVEAINERNSAGRVFFKDQQLGLADASGLIWPIAKNDHLKNKNFKEGDWLQFKCKIQKLSLTDLRQNDSYLILLTEIYEHIENSAEWKNPKILSPIPDSLTLESFPPFTENTCSFYLAGKTKKRFQLLQKRNTAIERTSQFFKQKGFTLIETPTLVPSGGVEVYLHSFKTTYTDHRLNEWVLQLPTSPEFALKKIMTEGIEKVFQLSRAYRNNGEVSKQHEPEFIMLEWYRAHATLDKIMEDTQKIVTVLAELLGSTIELPKQWPKFRVDELFKQLLNLNLTQLQDRDKFYQHAKDLSPSITITDDWDTLFYKLFMEKIEPFLLQQKACFVTHYPIQMGALARQEIHKNDQGDYVTKPFVERMEAYLNGIEICNGYNELNQADILLSRFHQTKMLRNDLIPDFGFENAMQFGMPTCSGNALGIDRVIAVLLELDNISTLYPIPFLSQFPTGTVAWE